MTPAGLYTGIDENNLGGSGIQVYYSECLYHDKLSLKQAFVEDEKGKRPVWLLEGEFQSIYKNKNRRVYSEAIIKRENERLNNKIREAGGLLCECDHPLVDPGSPTAIPRLQRVLLERACMIVREPMEFDGQRVYGKAEILDDDQQLGHKIMSIVNRGLKVGISSRALGGKANVVGDTFYVPEDIRFVTYDAVTDPSNHNSRLEAIMEEELWNLKQANKHERKLWQVLSDFAERIKK